MVVKFMCFGVFTFLLKTENAENTLYPWRV